MFFKSVKHFSRSCQEIALNEAIFAETNVTKATFKIFFFLTGLSW